MSNQAKYPKPVVGQVVWVEGGSGRSAYQNEATVAKVGRKWATLSGRREQRFDVETWRIDSESCASSGRVYPCREGREKELLVIAAWRNFAWRNLSDAIDRYRYSAPPNVTIEALQQAAELLGLEVKPS